MRDESDRLAITDLVLGQVSRPADERIVLDDTYRGKYIARAKIFTDEANHLLQRRGVELRRLEREKRLKARLLARRTAVGLIARLPRRLVGRKS